MKRLINKINHPYWLWEENKFNMWGKVSDREVVLKKIIEFTGNHKLYGKYMLRVVQEWKYSCEHNLSDVSQNRQAWIGHAACALAFKCPEDIVRQAWHYLTDHQRELANKEADKAIQYWEDSFLEEKNMRFKSGVQKEFKF